MKQFSTAQFFPVFYVRENMKQFSTAQFFLWLAHGCENAAGILSRDGKGASIKYVRTEGERGCQRNAQFCVRIILIGCVKSVQEGGRGSKKPENLRTYFMDAP